MIAALFVDTGGVYFAPGFDPWDEARDARLYAGPHPVIAHPPCARWCRLAGLVEKRWGHRRGDDGGCFAAALAAVRRWGGVIEHPAWSDAWAHFGLPQPSRSGGWAGSLFDPGYSAHVEQGRYGHPAKKATWLYVCGVRPELLPELLWGHEPDSERTRYWVSWCGNATRGQVRPRLGKKAALATPPEFQAVLQGLASLAKGTP